MKRNHINAGFVVKDLGKKFTFNNNSSTYWDKILLIQLILNYFNLKLWYRETWKYKHGK